jgi:hypothetical protein
VTRGLTATDGSSHVRRPSAGRAPARRGSRDLFGFHSLDPLRRHRSARLTARRVGGRAGGSDRCRRPGIAAGRPKSLEIGAILAFAAFTVASVVVDPGADDFLTRYARAIAAALLAAIALVSLLGTPFTEQYARESVDERYWSSPVFKRVNRQLTLMWALVFAAMVPSHLIAGALDTRRGNTIFNWVVPIVLIVWAAKRTEQVSAAAGDDVPASGTAPGSPRS